MERQRFFPGRSGLFVWSGAFSPGHSILCLLAIVFFAFRAIVFFAFRAIVFFAFLLKGTAVAFAASNFLRKIGGTLISPPHSFLPLRVCRCFVFAHPTDFSAAGKGVTELRGVTASGGLRDIVP